LSRGVHIMEQANVDQSVLMEGVVIEPGARLRRCIVDKNVRIPAGFAIGIDGAADAARFHVSTGGVVAVPKNYTID
jgi:glucose-1-phosphate adenylyltransferase